MYTHHHDYIHVDQLYHRYYSAVFFVHLVLFYSVYCTALSSSICWAPIAEVVLGNVLILLLCIHVLQWHLYNYYYYCLYNYWKNQLLVRIQIKTSRCYDRTIGMLKELMFYRWIYYLFSRASRMTKSGASSILTTRPLTGSPFTIILPSPSVIRPGTHWSKHHSIIKLIFNFTKWSDQILWVTSCMSSVLIFLCPFYRLIPTLSHSQFLILHTNKHPSRSILIGT